MNTKRLTPLVEHEEVCKLCGVPKDMRRMLRMQFKEFIHTMEDAERFLQSDTKGKEKPEADWLIVETMQSMTFQRSAYATGNSWFFPR